MAPIPLPRVDGYHSTGCPALTNAELPWDHFDTGWYLDHNYRVLRDDDQEIIRRVSDYFAAVCGQLSRGLDVGTGANLYPALTMLPFCPEITLSDRASSNVSWLKQEVKNYSSVWDPFWGQLARKGRYQAIGDPRAALSAAAAVVQGDILQPTEEVWDVGTMFFVAESLSGDPREFELAVHGFLERLLPAAPFAAAFMENSQGYRVDDETFPAVAVGVDDIASCLEAVAHNVDIYKIGTVRPLREGYDGMILALGRAGRR